MKTKPYEHQSVAFEKFKDSPYFALFWEMGAGKTKTTIDIAVHKYQTGQIDRVIVLAPNDVHAQWINEQFIDHCDIPYMAHVYQSKTTKKYKDELYAFLSNTSPVLKVLAIHFEAFQYPKIEEILKAFFIRGSKPLWVIDEATRIKNSEAKSSDRIKALRKFYGGQACILTGTSLAKGPVGIWNMVETISPGVMGCSFTSFRARHAVMMKREVEYKKKGVPKRVLIDSELSVPMFFQVKKALKNIQTNKGVITPNDYVNIAVQYKLSIDDVKFIDISDSYSKYKNIDMLKLQLTPFASFIKKQDCLDLPDKQYLTVEFPLTKQQRDFINSLKDYSIAMYGDKELAITHKASLQIRALQVCGGFIPHMVDSDMFSDEIHYKVTKMEETNAKLNYILDDLDELGDAQFLVWAVFRAELSLLTEELAKRTTVGLLAGDTPKSERAEIIAKFKAGELQGLVCNPEVAGYGLNLQNASVQYWYSRNYRTESRLQAEDRSHRIGITTSPIYKDLVYNAEFEKKVLESNRLGKEMNEHFNSSSIADIFKI